MFSYPFNMVLKGLILFFGMVAVAAAGSLSQNGFEQGMNTALAIKNKPLVALREHDPKKVFENYKENPAETRYQGNPGAMETDVKHVSYKGATAKLLQDSIKTHPQFQINPDTPEIQNIIKKSDDIYDVVTGQFGDCTKKSDCTINYQVHVCEESPSNAYRYCKKQLNVDLIPHQHVSHHPLVLHIKAPRYYIGLKINLVTGQLLFIQPQKDAKASLSGHLPSDLSCKGLEIKVQNTVPGLDGFESPTCRNGMNLTVHITRSKKDKIGDVDIALDIISKTFTYEEQDRWSEGCRDFLNVCTFQQEHCVVSESTRVIQGVPHCCPVN